MIESENNSDFEPPKSSSEEEKSSKNRDNHSKRMNELEKPLEAITNRSNLQEAKIIQPYMAEYPLLLILPSSRHRPYTPSIVKANRYIYYFKSQTGNVISNDAIIVWSKNVK